jgi:hypothetical protein
MRRMCYEQVWHKIPASEQACQHRFIFAGRVEASDGRRGIIRKIQSIPDESG